MLEKSLLNKKIIIKLVKENYDIHICRVNKIKRGSANIYKLIDKDDNAYILKEFQSKYSQDDINKEINIINYLRNKKVKVPEYISMSNGSYSFVNQNKTITLQRYIDGFVLGKNKGCFEQTLESAEYLGKIVHELESYKYKDKCNVDGWFKTDFDSSIKMYQDLILKVEKNEFHDEIIVDLNEKIEMLEKLKQIDFSDLDKMSIKYTHGDYSLMQFIYLDGKINAIIDFVSATYMPIAWEIIRSYSYIYYKNKNGKFDLDGFIPYVKKYLEYSDLNKYDLKYMCYIYLIQLLKSTFGYKQYLDNGNIDLLKFGMYRTNVCRFLINNASTISERLLEEIEI